MWKLLFQRNFGLLWWGGLISFTGDWMLRIALPAYVYDLTGSTLATGAMFMISAVPNLVFGSIAGVFVDRWNRQRALVIANLLLAIVLLPLLLVRAAEWLWIVYAIAFASSIINLVTGPAENALLPTLVDEDVLLSANSLNALNNNLARLIGPALGGVVALGLGLTGVALIDAATFAIAALLIAWLRVAPTHGETRSESAALSVAAVWREWIAGLRIVRHERAITIFFVITAFMALGEGVMAVLFVPFATDVLGGDTLVLGWLMSAQAVGGILGGLVIAQLGAQITPERMLGPSAVIFGLIDLLIFLHPLVVGGYTVAIVLFVLVGLPAAGVGASMTTLMQHRVADEYRGRVFGAWGTTFSLLTLIGMGSAALLGNLLPIVAVISVQGLAYVTAGVIALLFVRENSIPTPAPDQRAAQS